MPRLDHADHYIANAPCSVEEVLAGTPEDIAAPGTARRLVLLGFDVSYAFGSFAANETLTLANDTGQTFVYNITSAGLGPHPFVAPIAGLENKKWTITATNNNSLGGRIHIFYRIERYGD